MSVSDSSYSPDISVIIVSFNTRDLLRDCLHTLMHEIATLPHEIIVVDNASRDGSAAMVATEFPLVRLVRSDQNLGFAAANNRGFALARGRYVILLNSDAFPREGAIRRSVEHMDQHPQAGLGGGRLIGRDDSAQPSGRMFPSILNELLTLSGLAARHPESRLMGRGDRTWADPTLPAQVDWLPGAYIIIRRDLLERLGYFDERFFFYYEEVDLCRRIKGAGYQVWYWPDVVVVHLGGESARTVKGHRASTGAVPQLTLWQMRSQLLYYRKHHSAPGAWGAAMLATTWNRIRAWRNTLAAHRAKAEESRAIIALMRQAWRETHGGAVSPPRPW
jgi:hypothetical protein